MPGSFDLDNTTPPLWADAMTIGVYLYTPDAGEPYSLFPNVQCLRIDAREGPEPPVARFEYIMDDTLAINLGWPSQFENLWPIDAQGPYVVNPDDRIVVMGHNPDGTPLILFDGFAQVPQVDLTPRTQRVTFTAVGVAIREWDQPISGRTQRHSDPVGIQDTSGDSDVSVDLPCRFNPADTSVGGRGGYLPNRSPDGADTVADGSGGGSLVYPVFIDPGIERTPDPRGYWSISDAIKYLLAEYNNEQKYTDYPEFETLDALLQVEYAPNGQPTLTTADAESAPLTIRDYDASNKPYPEVIADLLSYAGFVMRWDTQADADGLPATSLDFYRRDGASMSPLKSVFLDPAGTTLDPSRNNIAHLHLARDGNSVVNAWQVETAQRLVEVSIVLAPLYQPASTDATAANRNQFFRSSWNAATSASTRRKYRWYGADECGDGHWTTSGSWSTSPFDFSAVFQPDDDGTPSYTVRYRPGSQTLVAVDSDGKPLRADLSISFDYEGAMSDFWDGTGTWQSIQGGWRLLSDRLGIEVTAEDPEQWSTGKGASATGGSGSTTAIVPGGDIRGVTWWAAPSQSSPCNGKPPVLRLTTVIRDDLRMPISAGKRLASPTVFARWRTADARDHFHYASIDRSSVNYSHQGGDGTDPVVIRDDTDAAMAHAYQLRAAHEFPHLAGSVSMPYITTFYQIGDRVEQVAGRDVSFGTNIAQDQGELPTYPWIVAISWSFEGDRQATTLQLSDRRAEA